MLVKDVGNKNQRHFSVENIFLSPKSGYDKNSFFYSAVNWKVAICSYSSPGDNSADGKFMWFGESGKCWVSRQKADWGGYDTPPFDRMSGNFHNIFPTKKGWKWPV